MSDNVTPGPFGLDERDVWKQCVSGVPKRGSDHIFHLPGGISDADACELVDLLNKGTHFDHMLEALKAARFAIHCNKPAYHKVRAALAKVEGVDE